jgi:hypothetical protein
MRDVSFLLACMLLFSTVSSSRADDYHRNAWGVVVGATTYGLTEGQQFELSQTNTSFDVGAFYTRFFTRSFSGRFELYGDDRQINTFAPVNPNTVFEATGFFSVDERVVETATVFSLDRRVDMGGHEARLSFGAGPTMSYVYDQTLGKPDPPFAFYSGDPRAGTYGKFGFMFDAGLGLAVDSDMGVFARFRYQQDVSTFAESDDADIVRQLYAFGFQAGMEFGF